MKEFDRHRSKEVYDKVLNRLPEGRLLDVGCGNGEFVYHANQSGRQAVGIDIPRSLLCLLNQIGFKAVSIEVKGMWGEGRKSNLLWKLLIFIGGIMGQGHLIYCWAKK